MSSGSRPSSSNWSVSLRGTVRLSPLGKDRGLSAIASGMPRSMTGSFSVETWSPAQLGQVDDAYLDRLGALYRTDRALQGATSSRADRSPESGTRNPQA